MRPLPPICHATDLQAVVAEDRNVSKSEAEIPCIGSPAKKIEANHIGQQVPKVPLTEGRGDEGVHAALFDAVP